MVNRTSLTLILFPFRLGAATAPWIDKEFVKIHKSASYLFMAVLAFITFCLLGLLKETKGVATQDTEDEEKEEPSKGDVLNAYELEVAQTNNGLDVVETNIHNINNANKPT